MKRVEFAAPVSVADKLLTWLYDRSLVHFVSMEPSGAGKEPSPEMPPSDVAASANDHVAENARLPFRPVESDAAAPERNVRKLRSVVELCRGAGALSKSFLESLLPVKRLATSRELAAAAEQVDVDALFEQAEQLRKRMEAIEENQKKLQEERSLLLPLQKLPVPPAELSRLTRVRMVVGRVPDRNLESLTRDAHALPFSIEVLSRKRAEAVIGILFAEHDAETVRASLEDASFLSVQLPDIGVTVAKRLEEIAAELGALEVKRGKTESVLTRFSAVADDAQLALGYWEAELNRAERVKDVQCSKRVLLASGYVRTSDTRELDEILARDFPSVSTTYRDPQPDEDVPVSLKELSVFRPARLLVDMFGLPGYFSFDPTPWLTFTFLLLFGICFSDAVYGLALIVLSLLLMRRFGRQKNLREFFRLFMFCGVSTFICGALVGSWAADLYSAAYLGEGNILMAVRNKLLLLDPLDKTMIALAGAIAIGIANQYFGIVLRMYRDALRRNWAGVIFDGVFWLVFLTGVIVLATKLFVDLSSSVLIAGTAVAGAGAVGLVATQGRHEETLPARIIVGIVSLYGIMGTYGVTGFLGDTLSYSRILALGLTTGIVGMSFNLIASLAGSAPWIGPVIFVLVALAGHSFNFVMGILSAFVHSARLILLEFFGRFYEPGAIPFRPFGFDSQTVEVVGE